MEKQVETEAGKFLLRNYRVDDEKKVLELWKFAFNQEMNQELWRWKYLENPYSQALLLCESDKKEILALYGGIPFKASRNGKEVVIVQLMDIMSHPDFRGKGLFVRTGKAFFEFFCHENSAELLYGFPGKFHFDLGKRIMGYAPLESRVVYLSGETGRLAAKKRPSLLGLERVEKPGPEFDRLWQRCSRDYPYAVVRDAEFICWRFCSHPEKKYEIWCLKKMFSREIQGYVVLAVGDNAATLADILLPESGKSCGLFFAKIGHMLKSRGVLSLSTWLPGGHFMKTAAIAAGFEEYDEPLGIISTIKTFDHSPDAAWIDNNLFYTMADADLF